MLNPDPTLMPLIIHPESSCDVCLESLTYDDSAPPFAIPCGHAFCRECLHHIYPRNCPLCREPYLLQHVKKLITGERPTLPESPVIEEGSAANDPEEDDLLRRLVVSWDMEEEGSTALLAEVDNWLQSRPANTSLPLRKARKTLTSFQELTTHAEDNQRTINHLKSSLRFHEHLASSDRFTAVAVEQSLLEQMEELHMKLSLYKSENETLREEISALKRIRRPLPPSPKAPLPGGFLPFVRPSGSGASTHHRHTSEGTATIYPTVGNIHTGPHSAPSSPTGEFELRTPSETKGKETQQTQEGLTWWDIHRSIVTASQDPPAIETGNPGANSSNGNVINSGGAPDRIGTRAGLRLHGSPVDSHGERPASLDLRFDNNVDQARHMDPYTPTAGTLRLIRNFPLFV